MRHVIVLGNSLSFEEETRDKAEDLQRGNISIEGLVLRRLKDGTFLRVGNVHWVAQRYFVEVARAMTVAKAVVVVIGQCQRLEMKTKFRQSH